MPRIARVKSDSAIYHIMARSISEVDLFKSDEDKKKYLTIVKDYQKLYNFRINAYCLMDNHLHLIVDTNGADISKVMHSINFKYAQYFNRKYKRHGHLFQDRFKSKIVEDEIYLIALSAYIHNNPTDVQGYENSPEKYMFSSLAIYLGLTKDAFKLVEDKFVLGLFGNNIVNARIRYKNLVLKSNELLNKNKEEFEEEKTEYRSERKILIRNFKIEEIVEFISKIMNIDKLKIHIKSCREAINARALLVVLLRSLCNAKCKTICSILGNITQSRVSNLSSLGIKLIDEDERYRYIFKEFIFSYKR